MARLGNAKHEQFARFIAEGTHARQEDAYVACGYKPANAKSHASHLIKRPEVRARIEELQGKALAPVIGDGTELAEACPWLTVTWFAAQYDLIRQKAMAAGDMKTASATVKNVQSLIDLETRLATEKAAKPAPVGRIDVNALGGILDKVAAMIDVSKSPDQSGATSPAMKAHRAAENQN
ncbi:terminase small subunit [Arenibacterium sp. CAU 1754]